ncbi:MAG: type II secretion system protein [bacterium JZ-2024 1]
MRKGFTLIELLVVMVIIGILIGMAVPNYIKVKERAKETQVQAGLHIIRVALERYAVDWDGLYPVVLTGGDQLYNFATTDGAAKGGYYETGCPYHSAFLNFWPCDFETDDQWCIRPRVTVGQLEKELPNLPPFIANKDVCMDGLLMQGYLQQYPKNPFIKPDPAGTFGPLSVYLRYGRPYAIAGRYGDRMVEASLGDGDAPGTMFFINDPIGWWNKYPVANNWPGNFYYHPIFCDGFTVAEHAWALVEPSNPYGYCSGCNTSYGRMIKQHAVCGYVLTGITSSFNAGRDATHVACGTHMDAPFSYMRMPSGYYSLEHDPIALPVRRTTGGWYGWYCLSGGNYFSQGNPYALPPGDEVGTSCQKPDRSDCGSGPDGYPDYFLPLLAGGTDKKPQMR